MPLAGRDPVGTKILKLINNIKIKEITMRKYKGIRLRYNFAKKIYPHRLIIFKTKNGFKSIGKDQILLDYIITNKLLRKLNTVMIDYIILDNMDIIDEGTYENNNYYRYVKISQVDRILTSIKINYINRVNL